MSPHVRSTLPPAWRLSLLWLACTLLVACQGDSHEAALEEYLVRLARTLDVPRAAVPPTPLPLPPRTGAVRLDIPAAAIDTLDFLALTGCALQVTIGKRNSSLGRMASDSQRLLLELEYLRLAPECIEYQRRQGHTELAASLQAAWHTKREQLPQRIFNATLAGREYRQFWRSKIPPGDYPEATGSQVLTAMEGINRMARQWLAGDYRADNQAFEILLGEVATGDGGALLEALARQSDRLAAADAMLAQRLERGPLCAPGIRQDAADILPNVIQRFFIGGIQPHAASLGRRRHQLLPPVTELENLLESAQPLAFRTWRRQRNALLEELAGAPRRHVDALQAIQAPCGGLPAAAR